MRILVADDAPINRVALTSMLRKQGHHVITVENGREAVEAFERDQPEMVIMDVMMPQMDGYDATRLIKARTRHRFTPIIFVTAMSDEESLVHCIQHGGDDFLTKPYNPVILKAKIDALSRIRDLYAVIQEQNADLTRFHDRLTREQELASAVLTRILRSGALQEPNLRYWLSPAAIMNGDLLLVSRTPLGSLHVMLGDFTGHGLAAAVCALPAAQVFYDMTAQGYGVGEIAGAINRTLKAVLPSHLFCAGCLLELDPTGRRLTLWNGGLPDVLLWRPGVGVYQRVPSEHLPLGIVTPEFFRGSSTLAELAPEDRVYLYSDGLIEATDTAGAMFGQAGLEDCLQRAVDPSSVFAGVRARVSAFVGDAALHDDIALVELTAGPLPAPMAEPIGVFAGTPAFPARFQTTLEFGAEGLRRGDMLPTLMPLLTGLHGMAPQKESILLVLKELLNNALEHGLLRLDSSMKATAAGFEAYYGARERALAALREGWIKVQVSHEHHGAGGTVVIRVEDSGDGFDHRAEPPPLPDNTRPWARGIPLVRSLCRDLLYHGKGNVAEAVIVW